MEYTLLEINKEHKQYYSCVYKGKGAKYDFNSLLYQDMRNKGRTLKVGGIRKTKMRINAKLAEDMRVEIHAVKYISLLSIIRDATERFWYAVVKAASSMGVLKKYAMEIIAVDIAEGKTEWIWIAWLHQITIKTRIKLNQPYRFILMFVRFDIIIGGQVDIQIGKDELKCCFRRAYKVFCIYSCSYVGIK